MLFIMILLSMVTQLTATPWATKKATSEPNQVETSKQEKKETPKKRQKARSDVALTWDKLGKFAQFVTSTRKVISFFDPNKISHFLEYQFIPQELRNGYEFLELIAPGAVSAALNYGLKTLITAPLDSFLEKKFPLQQKTVQDASYYGVQMFRQLIKVYDPTSQESMAERFVCNHYGQAKSSEKETALKRVRMATIVLDGLGVIAAIYTLQQQELAWSTNKQNKPINYFGKLIPALKNFTITYENFMKKYHQDSRATKLIAEFSAQVLPVLSALSLGGIEQLPFVNLGGALDALIFKLRTYGKKQQKASFKTELNGEFSNVFN